MKIHAEFLLASLCALACSSPDTTGGAAESGGAAPSTAGGHAGSDVGSGGASGGSGGTSTSGAPGAGGATTAGQAGSNLGAGGAPAAAGTAGVSGGGGLSSNGGSSNGGSSSGGSSSGGSSSGGSSGGNGSGGMSTGGSAASCGIPSYDASHPPATLALTGNLGTHDPAVIAADGVYYLFATGNGIATKKSTDLRSWSATPDVFSSIPSWVGGKVSGVTNIWAPDISNFGGKYHLYYAVSTFGTNKSCIGHATRDSLSTGSWTDHGPVICSNVGTNDNFNAIDPNVVVDDAGTPWLAFGSFWSGIKLIQLDADGNRVGTGLTSIASHSSIEGAFIVHQCGYYYLFVSFGSCCTSPYDYDVRVGRAKSVQGPYTDKAGTDMMNGGGNLIVQGNSTWTAPGHNAILVTKDGAYDIYHALNGNHQNPTLRIAELALDAQGWPVSGGP